MTGFKTLTRAEEQIMQALWKIGKGFTKNIIAALPAPKPHYNTASTLLRILTEKGFVKTENNGKTNLYTPAVAKDAYSKASMKQLLKGYFDGSFSSMLSFFAQEKDISLQELEEVIHHIKSSQ